MHPLRVLALLISLTSLSWVAYANQDEPATPPITVKAEVNRSALTIGDPVEYTVTVRHQPNVQVLTSIKAPDSDILKVKNIKDINRKSEGSIITGKEFTLTTFRLGSFILDPVEIKYRVDNGDIETISTDKIYLQVNSILSEGEEIEDIRGIKSVVSIPQKLLRLLVLIMIVILLPFIGVYIYVRFFRKSEDDETPEIILTPAEEALQNLNRLFDSDLLRNDKYKQYYLHLSEILRIYLEKRFEILAVESTTKEIEMSFKSDRPIPNEIREKIIHVLESADLAKFAKWIPEPTEVLNLNKMSKEIVEETKPQETSSEEVSDAGV